MDGVGCWGSYIGDCCIEKVGFHGGGAGLPEGVRVHVHLAHHGCEEEPCPVADPWRWLVSAAHPMEVVAVSIEPPRRSLTVLGLRLSGPVVEAPGHAYERQSIARGEAPSVRVRARLHVDKVHRALDAMHFNGHQCTHQQHAP
jgi:hypothetical protein